MSVIYAEKISVSVRQHTEYSGIKCAAIGHGFWGEDSNPGG